MKSLKVHSRNLILLVSFLIITIPSQAQSWNEVIKIAASKPAGGSKFGKVVAISGDWAIVGAEYHGLDKNETNYQRYAGAAYIFKKDAQGNWIQSQKLCIDKRYQDHHFGCSVSISEKYAIVGAFGKGITDPTLSSNKFKKNAGAAYIYEKNKDGEWEEVQQITSSEIGYNFNFGISVSISGHYAIIGANRSKTYLVDGAAFIFERNADGKWEEIQKLEMKNGEKYDEFGQHVYISSNYALVGAQKFIDGETNYVGTVHIYERNTKGNWNEIQRITASDKTEKNHFGESLSISGDFLVVGAYGSKSNDVKKGAVYIFKKSSKGKWKESQKLVASNGENEDYFGGSVSISGKFLVVGSEGCDAGPNSKESGSVYIFELNAERIWNEVKMVSASDAGHQNRFGISVSISGQNIIVGAHKASAKDNYGIPRPETGACYVFKK